MDDVNPVNMAQLCERYGFERLTKLQTIYWTVPDSMPRKSAIKALSSGLEISEEAVECFLRSVKQIAPRLLERAADNSQVYFLCPPTNVCLFGCGYASKSRFMDKRELIAHRDRIEVTVYDLHDQPCRGFEYTLRCSFCKSRFGYSWYYDHSKKSHFLYDCARELLFVNERVYWTRKTVDLLLNSILHAQCTFEGFAEILRTTFHWSNVFERRQVSCAFYANEIECELRTRGIQFAFPTRKINCQKVKDILEKYRLQELYAHDCGPKGYQRGCPYLHVMDGVWKLCFRHCSMKMENKINIKHVNLPPVCENSPIHGHLYCVAHIDVAKMRDLALTKSDLLLRSKDQVPKKVSKGHLNVYEEEMYVSGKVITDEAQTTPSGHISCDNKYTAAPWCKKDLGRRTKVNCWSRGLFVFVHGCGHISSFTPLYQSESMSQVFVIVMEWLHKRLRQIPVSEWNKVFLCYDNMCNFGRLKALNEKLPASFSGDYAQMWSSIQKIIDGLHLQNHTRESCKRDYNPDTFGEAHPDIKSANTMAAEQAFSWLTKFKKQVNSTTKSNQLFFLHRLIVRRNAYNASCLQKQIPPLTPGPRSNLQRAGF